MPRGGERTGKIGQTYGNRSDLNAPKVPTIVPKGAQYGQRQALEMSQKALPVGPGSPGAPAPIGAPAPPPAPGAAPMGGGPPAPPLDFHRPTERPGEPVTHGLPSGPGGGPEVLGSPGADPITIQLRALYSRYPSQELADLLSEPR